MKTATELLGELLRIYDEPEKGAAELHSWVHQSVEEIRGLVEGEEIEPEDLSLALSGLGLPGYRGPFEPMDPPTPTRDEAAENAARRMTPEFAEKLGRMSGSRAAIDRARGEGE